VSKNIYIIIFYIKNIYIYIKAVHRERERRNSKYTYSVIVIVILQQIISIKINVYTFQILRSPLLFIISIIFVF